MVGTDEDAVRKAAQETADANLRYCYAMGRDYAKNGATMINCHWALFNKPEYTEAWERGKREFSSSNKG